MDDLVDGLKRLPVMAARDGAATTV